MKKDDYVRVLDYLPKGKSEVPPHKRKPLVQGLGDKYFSLLELSPKEGADFELSERVYIGEESRQKIDHIERRIKYDWLTPTAKSELPHMIREVIEANEKEFLDFYNTAGTISTRQHKLETLPKIGRRHREEILQEREITPFQSFEDMRKRLTNIPDPVSVLVDKIVEELKGESKYYLFTPIVEEGGGQQHRR
jgi:putative nucleotide binding protein